MVKKKSKVHALDQESDQEKRKEKNDNCQENKKACFLSFFLFSLMTSYFFPTFLYSFINSHFRYQLISCIVYIYLNHSTMTNIYTTSIVTFIGGLQYILNLYHVYIFKLEQLRIQHICIIEHIFKYLNPMKFS